VCIRTDSPDVYETDSHLFATFVPRATGIGAHIRLEGAIVGHEFHDCFYVVPIECLAKSIQDAVVTSPGMAIPPPPAWIRRELAL
jgi:hypothetical protein